MSIGADGGSRPSGARGLRPDAAVEVLGAGQDDLVMLEVFAVDLVVLVLEVLGASDELDGDELDKLIRALRADGGGREMAPTPKL